MAAFKEIYIPKVEAFLERSLTEEEILKAKQLYVEGWHPRRTANYLIGLSKIEPVDRNTE